VSDAAAFDRESALAAIGRIEAELDRVDQALAALELPSSFDEPSSPGEASP